MLPKKVSSHGRDSVHHVPIDLCPGSIDRNRARPDAKHPRIDFLGEASSVLDEGHERALYELQCRELSDVIGVGVCHRGTLGEFHAQRLHLASDACRPLAGAG